MSIGKHFSFGFMKKQRVSASGCSYLSMRCMKAACYSVPGYGQITCTLWRLTPDPLRGEGTLFYAIGMVGPGYRRLRIVGRDEEQARDVFALLVRHTVTPCALGDVLEELVDLPWR